MNNALKIKNNGFSLIELMIAMTLGIFLIAGVSTVYISSKQTYKLRDQTSELDENARAALRALKHHVAHAGYASTSGIVVPNYIIPNGALIADTICSDGNSNIVDTDLISTTSDGVSGASDTIGLIFIADDQLNTDCTGTMSIDEDSGQATGLRSDCLAPKSAVRMASRVYNSFSVGSARNNLAGDPIPELRCAGSLNPVPQPWAEGVDNIQFQYGVDLNADGAVDNYWNATLVGSNNAWAQIISVRIGLLIRSIEPAFQARQSQKFQVLDQIIEKINTPDTLDALYKYGVYTTTVRLKNVARRVE